MLAASNMSRITLLKSSFSFGVSSHLVRGSLSFTSSSASIFSLFGFICGRKGSFSDAAARVFEDRQLGTEDRNGLKGNCAPLELNLYSAPHRRASTRPDRVKLRWHSEFQGIVAPRAAAKREYHSSRLKETETALAQARNRSGREVPNTGWIFAGCLRSQASSMASAVVSWRRAYFCTKRAVSFTFPG